MKISSGFYSNNWVFQSFSRKRTKKRSTDIYNLKSVSLVSGTSVYHEQKNKQKLRYGTFVDLHFYIR